MNKSYVADTMAIVLRLEKRKMGNKTKEIFKKIENMEALLFIPAMVLAEIGYLSEKNKIETSLDDLRKYLKEVTSIKVDPITEEIIYKTFEIDDIPELHDRIIAGTAYSKNLEIITNDPIIINSKFVSTVW